MIPHPDVVAARAELEQRIHLRELAHQKLDEALDMYFEGWPRIETQASWFGSRVDDRLRINITPAYG